VSGSTAASLGYLDDPGERMGMLQAQAFRAARVVMDIGMHLELEMGPMGLDALRERLAAGAGAAGGGG
jgi:uncharacterized protein (DUF885 family)